MADYCSPGDRVSIGRLPGLYERLPDAVRYDYDDGDRCRCPACGGLGAPWGGWFSCEQADRCGAVALIETGEVFRPVVVGSSLATPADWHDGVNPPVGR